MVVAVAVFGFFAGSVDDDAAGFALYGVEFVDGLLHLGFANFVAAGDEDDVVNFAGEDGGVSDGYEWWCVDDDDVEFFADESECFDEGW